jgi:flavin-dependent dehydrogenase
VLAHILESCPVLRPVLDGADVDGSWLSAGVIQPGIRQRYIDGTFVVGNAAGEAHPVVAEGISMAMQSAWLLAERLKAQRGDLHRPSVRNSIGRSYSAAWKLAFASRIYAAAVIAQWASRPRMVQVVGPLLAAFPGLVTWGAQLSGKSQVVVQDESHAQKTEWRPA